MGLFAAINAVIAGVAQRKGTDQRSHPEHLNQIAVSVTKIVSNTKLKTLSVQKNVT